MEEQKHVLQVIVVRKVIGRTFSTKDESPFNSSSTTPSISGTSCWLLKLKGSLRIDDILHCRALKKFVGSTAGRDERLNKDILRTMDLTSGTEKKTLMPIETTWLE